MKFSGKVGNGPMNKPLNFGGDPDHRLDTAIIFLIRHYWETLKVVNGHISAAHTDSPDGGTGKTCLGGGMHCPSVSILIYICQRQEGNTPTHQKNSNEKLQRNSKPTISETVCLNVLRMSVVKSPSIFI